MNVRHLLLKRGLKIQVLEVGVLARAERVPAAGDAHLALTLHLDWI